MGPLWLVVLACGGAQPRATPSPDVVARPPEPATVKGGVEGMVVPAKGGFVVGGVFVDHDALVGALAPYRPVGAERDWPVGCSVRLDARVEQEPGMAPSDEPSQGAPDGRDIARELRGAELLAQPIVIEGELHRSKGLWGLDGYLIHRGSLRAALLGVELEGGETVRLVGQARVVVCGPMEQCLSTGELPMFEIGSASIVSR